MRRRLIVAFVALALLAVVLVGAGVLLLAGVGARAEARSRVLDRVEAVAETLPTGADRAALAIQLERQQRAFDFQTLEVVIVGPSGNVTEPQFVGRRDDQRLTGTQPQATLTGDELEAFLAGEAVSYDRDADVVGLIRLDLGDTVRAPDGADLGLILAEQVTPLTPRTRQWFAISAGIVVLAAIGAATIVSGRFVAPIRAIEATTRRLAGGDLAARVEVDGDDEVADLGRSVNTMAADLERSRQLEQQFLLSVSHDLRTPLTAIRAYGEALSDGAVDDTERAGDVITNNADRLTRLVADLLQLARLDARQFELDVRTVDLRAVAARHLDGLAPVAERHHLALHLDGDDAVPVTADGDRVAQIIANLVENAVKYAATTIVVATRVDHDAGVGVLTVVDDGPGIPGSDLPHVFERLYVTQARPIRAEQSSGLGLAIVQQLTGAMGGSVSVRSPVGDHGGTAFEVCLPLTGGTPAHTDPISSPAAG